MTLIMTEVSRLFVLHVADRLVTRDRRPFDRTANKTVVYRARDGIVAMSYTGPAYIAGLPSDQYIAEFLSGHPFRPGERIGFMVSGPIAAPWLHLGPMLEAIRERISVEFATARMAHARTMNFELLVTGWQWYRRKRPRPVYAGIEKPAGMAQAHIWRGRRHFGRDFALAVTPEGQLAEKDYLDTNDALRKAFWRADEAEAALVDRIRSAAARPGSNVGPHCMSILLFQPNMRRVRIRFLSPDSTQLALTGRDGAVASTLPAAFSPWVIGPRGTLAPAILSGTITAQVEGFDIVIEAPEPTGGTVRGAMGGVSRPPEPR